MGILAIPGQSFVGAPGWFRLDAECPFDNEHDHHWNSP
jgi:hypothetical protein